MCGVVGFWRFRPSHRYDDDQLAVAVRRIEHRGPEGTTLLREPDLSVAHCRLTFHQPGLVDQPYVTPCRRYTIAFNGEIYNYGALRRDLEGRGCSFSSFSEAELIYHCYIKYGYDFPKHLRGMFAIVLRDRAEDTLLLCRDFIGKKPLYYSRTGDTLYFSSELGGLEPFLDSKDLNGPAITSFFLLNAVDSRLCLLAGASKVAPGELVVATAFENRLIRYWTPPIARETEPPDVVEQLSDLLRQAVSRRLLNNGTRLGLMLSGGLDSSLVAAFAAAEGHTLPTYSVRFDDSEFDESRHAARVAGMFQADHHVVQLTGERMTRAISRLFSTVDEPIADPSLLGVWAVAEAAKADVKGLLTGDGADDLFAGYQFFRTVRALNLARHVVPSPLLALVERACARMPDRGGNLSPRTVAQLLSRGLRVEPEWQHAFCTSAFTPDELMSVLTPDARALVSWPFEEPIPQGGSAMSDARLGVLRTFLQGPILTKLDRGAMASGVELRSPFLDQDVAEYALSLPMSTLVNASGTKATVREVARRLLPQDICDRPKRGFRLPVQRLLRNSARELLLDTLSAPALRRGGLLDVPSVQALLDQHLVQGLNRSKQLWALLAFTLWHQRVTSDRAPALDPLDEVPCAA